MGAEKIGKAILTRISIIMLMMFTVFGIFFLYTKISPNTIYILLYQIFTGVLLAMNMVTIDIFLIETFNRNIRYSCFGVSHDVGLAIAGITPFLVTLLIYHKNYFALSAYIIITSILAFLAIYALERLARGSKKAQAA